MNKRYSTNDACPVGYALLVLYLFFLFTICVKLAILLVYNVYRRGINAKQRFKIVSCTHWGI